MRNLIILLSFTALIYGCAPNDQLTRAQAIKDIGCVIITEESRAEIREKQNVKTNICGDDLTDE